MHTVAASSRRERKNNVIISVGGGFYQTTIDSTSNPSSFPSALYKLFWFFKACFFWTVLSSFHLSPWFLPALHLSEYLIIALSCFFFFYFGIFSLFLCVCFYLSSSASLSHPRHQTCFFFFFPLWDISFPRPLCLKNFRCPEEVCTFHLVGREGDIISFVLSTIICARLYFIAFTGFAVKWSVSVSW